MSTNATDELLYETRDGIATITFNRPKARNALTFEMYDQLLIISTNLARDHRGISALIINGAGDKAFAAGTDISRFREFTDDADAIAYEHRIDQVLSALESIPVPTVAAIRGACTGGGAAIAACCDLRIASPDLKYGFPIARTLGNCLSLNSLSRIASLLGEARTREIIFTSRLIKADEASAIALVSEVVEDPLARARELAEQMKLHAPLTLQSTKEGLRRLRNSSSSLNSDDLITRCYGSNDFKEGLEAFLAKRPPNWTGT
ncbi:enoyl-CoA hydratase [Chromatiales bacterium (ex Bugula neritina AB1)]|nr:enoyl-CoA hydratase [Chromatiales bacterium (ex Bugula neritina AB1)]